jgi:hypothetical protein
MIRLIRRFYRTCDAGPIVEFAIVVPVLLLLLFGIIDFARAFFQRNNLVAAAREGARFAAVQEFPCNAATQAAVRERVIGYFSAVGDAVPASNSIVVSPEATVTGVCPDGISTVMVMIANYPFTPLTPLLRVLGGAQRIQLQARAVYRWERAP